MVDYILNRLPPAFDWLQLRAIEAVGWGKAKKHGEGRAGAAGATGATERASRETPDKPLAG